MTELQVLQELEGIVERLSITIRYEAGNMRGGLCRINDKLYIIINKNLRPGEKTAILLQALKTLPLDNIYILPQIRALIDSA
jgi:hypothetical protein